MTASRIARERSETACRAWTADVRGRTQRVLQEQHRRAALARSARIDILRVALENIARWSRVRFLSPRAARRATLDRTSQSLYYETMNQEDLIRQHLERKLTSRKRVEEVARSMKGASISPATLYRYRRDPGSIPLRTLVALSKRLHFPLTDTIQWTRQSFLDTEEHRLELERELGQGHGRRQASLPAFPVTDEIPELTEYLYGVDYGAQAANGEYKGKYLKLRADRRELYRGGAYESVELLSGPGYSDFFFARGRYRGIPPELRARQIEALIASCNSVTVHRRIRLFATPELPPFITYSASEGAFSVAPVALIRLDDFVLTFRGGDIYNELREIFEEHYAAADLKTQHEVVEFMRNPETFLR